MRILALSALVAAISLDPSASAAPHAKHAARPVGRRHASAAPRDPSGDVQAPPDQALSVTLPDGVSITLEPGSRGRWFPKGKLPSETNKWAIGYHLLLREGELDVRMPVAPKGSHAFLVQTRAGTLTDWRGTLHVAVHEDKTTAAIYEGALVVGSNGQGFPVYDGAGILMRKGVNPDKSRGIPPAPVWDAARGAPSLLVERAGSARGTVGFSWKSVPGAATYRVEVARDPQMAELLEIATTSDTTHAMVERGASAAGGGEYWARVRAVGPEGIVGEWSAPRPLRVVHYALPDGAFVAPDAAIVLPRHESVSLTDAQGLEVAYATSARSLVPLYWAPLDGVLYLPEDATARVVHLRDPALGQETTLTLAHRMLRADVQMTPRDPKPGDAIDVRVVAWDPSGRIDAARERVTLETTLDIDPLPVAWHQAGNTWTAHMDPPVRPTVVRVVVKDGYGEEIGRGFVEIGGAFSSFR